MWRLIRAEAHQLRWAQAASLALAAALYGIIHAASRRLPTHANDAGVTLNYLLTLLVCATPILHAWTADWGQTIGTRYRLLETLPLPRWRLNLSRLLGAVLSLWPVLLASVPLWWLLRSIYGPRSMWLALWVALALLHLLLMTMVWRGTVLSTLGFLVLAVVPLYAVPELGFVVTIPIRLLESPWPALALGLEIVLLSIWALPCATSPPRVIPTGMTLPRSPR